MRISKKAEYALRAMVSLGRKPRGTTASIEEICEDEKIPVKFLEQILLELRKASLLLSRRGVKGGYQLARPVGDISLLEIIRVIDGPFQPISCTPADTDRFGRGVCDCGTPGGCGLGKVFCELQKKVNAFLTKMSLADVIAKEAKAGEISFDI